MFKDRAIVLLAIGQCLIWASLFYIFPALLLRWEQDLGWSRTELTAGITLAVCLSGLVAPIAGRLIDSGRGPETMAGATVLGGVAIFCLSGITVVWQFYCVCSLAGIAMAGCLYDPCFALITRSRGINARRAIIIVTLVAGFASAISFPLAHLVSEAIGWRAAVACAAAVAVFLAAPVTWLGARIEESSVTPDSGTPTVSEATQRRFIANPSFWLLAAGFTMIAVLHGTVLHHLLPMLHERGVADNNAILVVACIGPMQVAGRLLMMASGRHSSNLGVTVAAFLMLGISILLLLSAGTSLVFMAAFVVMFGCAYGTVSIVRPLTARDVLGGKNFGAKSGALAMPYQMGSAAAPYLGALVWSIGSYDLVLQCLILLSVLAIAFYLAANRATESAALE
ncbi:MAG TPA: MFS transporter [Gammaproteobacteria bacterium]|nr:MFS transporter [Gammaproteobacteria bacterium]